jgi:hypothetical protein
MDLHTLREQIGGWFISRWHCHINGLLIADNAR